MPIRILTRVAIGAVPTIACHFGGLFEWGNEAGEVEAPLAHVAPNQVAILSLTLTLVTSGSQVSLRPGCTFSFLLGWWFDVVMICSAVGDGGWGSRRGMSARFVGSFDFEFDGLWLYADNHLK